MLSGIEFFLITTEDIKKKFEKEVIYIIVDPKKPIDEYINDIKSNLKRIFLRSRG